MKQRALRILWPAFFTAAVLDAAVFAVVDPQDLHWLGGAALGWSPQAVYSVTFLIFWAATAAGGAVTVLLGMRAAEINQPLAAPATLQRGRRRRGR